MNFRIRKLETGNRQPETLDNKGPAINRNNDKINNSFGDSHRFDGLMQIHKKDTHSHCEKGFSAGHNFARTIRRRLSGFYPGNGK
ncbi:MAG: hypothetical protein ACXWV1_11285 [Chitinophagaceae bacterium]